MKGLEYFLFYIIFLAYVAQKDYYSHQYGQKHVHVSAWICHKTKIIRFYRTKVWNETLFTLPGVYTTPSKPDKPIEYLLFSSWDIISVPYSDEAALMELHPSWKDKEDSVCFITEKPLSVCNLFEGCLFWPLFAPLKPVGWIILLMLKETAQI
jgi:hypothetical protein